MAGKIKRFGRFNVRVVEQGDAYGRNDCLMHKASLPLVEFYDAAQSVDVFGPRGQFVSRYYLETLESRSTPKQGLRLHGAHPVWTVPADELRAAVLWARDVVNANRAKALLAVALWDAALSM